MQKKLHREFSTPEWPRFVAGAMGPTTKTLSVTGGITFEELEENFYMQAKALIEGWLGFNFTRNKSGYAECKSGDNCGINRAFEELG